MSHILYQTDSIGQTLDRKAAEAADLLTDAALGNALLRKLEARWAVRPELAPAPIDPAFSQGYEDGTSGRPEQMGRGAAYTHGWLAGRRTIRRTAVQS